MAQASLPPTSLYTLFPVRAGMGVGILLLLAHRIYLPASFLIIVLIVLEGCRFWANIGLTRLTIRREIHPLRLFPGEEAILKIKIENKKWLPVSLEWMDFFPAGLEASSAQGSSEYPQKSVPLFLKGHAEISITTTVRGVKRGCYKIHPGTISSRDILGLFNRKEAHGNLAEILVYPKPADFKELMLAPTYLMGDIRTNRPFLPDPTWVASLRDYTPDTPSRLIHWKASARQDILLAKVLENTADLRICIVLDGDSFEQSPTRSVSLERALSAAATLAIWAEKHRIPFGLLSNLSQCGVSGPILLPVGSSPSQVRLALESLARAELSALLPFTRLLREEITQLPWGTTLLVICADGSARSEATAGSKTAYIEV